MTHAEMTVHSQVELHQTEGLQAPQIVEMSDLLRAIDTRSPQEKAADAFARQDFQTEHGLVFPGAEKVDYLITFNPKKYAAASTSSERSVAREQARMIELERRVAKFENSTDPDTKRSLEYNRDEAARLHTQLVKQVWLGMDVVELKKIDPLPKAESDMSALDTPLGQRIAQGIGVSARGEPSKVSHGVNALAGGALLLNPAIIIHEGVSQATAQQAQYEATHILGSLAVADPADVQTDENGQMYQLVVHNGKELRVNLDESQLKYLEKMRQSAVAAAQPADAVPQSFFNFFPRVDTVNRNPVPTVDPTIGTPTPTDGTPTPPGGTDIPPITPTNEPPTVTVTATATEVEKQGPVDIQPDAKVADSDAHFSDWRLAQVAAGTGEVKGEYKGDRLMADGTVGSMLFMINGKPELVPPDKVDETDILNHYPAVDADLPVLEKSIVDGPLVVEEGMGGTFIDGYVRIGTNHNIEYKVDALVDPNGPQTQGEFGASKIVIVSGRKFLALNYDTRGSFVYVTNMDTQHMAKFDVDGDLSSRPVLVRFEGDRESIQLIDGNNGNPIYLKDSNGNRLDKLTLSDEYRFDHELWSVGYNGSSNDLTINEFSLKVKNGPDVTTPSILPAEQERGNGLKAYSDKESIVISQTSLDPTRSPNFGNIVNENAGAVDFSKGYFLGLVNLMNPDGSFEIHQWSDRIIMNYLDENGIKYVLPIDVKNMSDERATRSNLSNNIRVITTEKPQQPVVIRNLFKTDGSIDRDIPYIKVTYRNVQGFLTDLVTQLNEAGAPARFVFPKTNKASFDKMFTVVQGLKTQHQVEGINVDIGGFSRDEAIDALTQLKALGVKVRVYVAGNVGGLQVRDIVAITELIGVDERIIEISGDEKDPTKVYLVNSVDDNNTSTATYTPAYYEYRDALNQASIDKGHT